MIEKNKNVIRLDKAMAEMNIASRREAKSLIIEGHVLVNGIKVINPGKAVNTQTDKIVLDDKSIKKEYILVNKPIGIETNKTSTDSIDLRRYFPMLKHLYPVGRLDKNTSGLIIMTNDGLLTRKITLPNSKIGKKYLVKVRENVTDKSLQMMREGLILDMTKTKPAILSRLSRNSFTIVLNEGRKHQIRRMADKCHLTIESLERIAIGKIGIEKMKSGDFRKLSEKEIKDLFI